MRPNGAAAGRSWHSSSAAFVSRAIPVRTAPGPLPSVAALRALLRRLACRLGPPRPSLCHHETPHPETHRGRSGASGRWARRERAWRGPGLPFFSRVPGIAAGLLHGHDQYRNSDGGDRPSCVLQARIRQLAILRSGLNPFAGADKLDHLWRQPGRRGRKRSAKLCRHRCQVGLDVVEAPADPL